MKMQSFAALCVAIAVLCGTSMVHADTVVAKLVGLDPFSGGDLSLGGSPINGDGVGLLLWDGTGQGNVDPGFQGKFSTFCLDLIDSIAVGGTDSFFVQPALAFAPNVAAGGPMGALKATVFYSLYGNFFAGLGTANDFQAFQLAVWSIVYNANNVTSVNNNANNFYVVSGLNSSVITEANSFLNTAWSLQAPFNTSVAALIGSDDPHEQDQVIPTPTTGGPFTPLPHSAMSGGALLAGLGLIRWLKARSAARRAN